MSTSSSVIFQSDDGKGGENYKGIIVNFDGYPSGVGKRLRRLVTEHGVDVVREKLLEHPDWRAIDPETNHNRVDERFHEAAVLGWGEYYYTDTKPDDYLLPYIDPSWRNEHVYLVSVSGTVLWARSPQEAWLDVEWRDDWSDEGEDDNA